MTAIAIELLTGRYHATPWDRHVNEGEVEWPPSPWRVLRSLVATWHRKAQTEIEEQTLLSICERLAAQSPRYKASSAVLSHTRHYMPSYRGSDLVFDGFIDTRDASASRREQDGGREALVIVWRDVQLDAEERRALSLLVERMGYLGRAESWIAARLLDETEEQTVVCNCLPVAKVSDSEQGESVEQERPTRAGSDRLRLLAPMPPADYQDWRAGEVARRSSKALRIKKEKVLAKGKDPEKVKLSPKERERIEGQLPQDTLRVLEQETGALRKAGWSRPPGSVWLVVERPRGLLDSPRAVRSVIMPEVDLPTVARFALASNAPPDITQSLAIAEDLRRWLLDGENTLPVFGGHDDNGRPSQDHQHFFILPEANDGKRRGKITHVTLFARSGFSEEAIDRIANLARRFSGSAKGLSGRSRAIAGREVQLILLGVGKPEQFVGGGGEVDTSAGQCALLASSKVWVSRTPFVATRHPKSKRGGEPKIDTATGYQSGSPIHDLHRLLVLFLEMEPVKIGVCKRLILRGRETSWLDFRTRRRHGSGTRAGAPPCGFQVEFSEPVSGPIAVGYGAHFGLGQFVPKENADR